MTRARSLHVVGARASITLNIDTLDASSLPMALYSRRNARRSLIDTAFFRAVSQVATVLGYVVMVRGMSEQDFGVLSLLYAFIPVVSTVASLGLEQTLRRYQPEYLGAGNVGAADWLVQIVSRARLGTTVVVLGLILATWNYTAPLFKLADYRLQFAMFGVLIMLFFQVRVLKLAFAGRMMHRYSVGGLAIMSIVKLVAYGTLVSRGALSLTNAIVADTIAYAVTFAVLKLVYVRRRTRGQSIERFRPAPEERKRLMRYSFLNNFNDAGAYVLSAKSDNFFIAAFLDAVSVGIYSFYSRLNNMAVHLLPLKLFDNVVQPLFFSVQPADAQAKIPRYFSLLLDTGLVLQWPVLAFACVYHFELVEVVFAGKFIDYSWLLPLVVLFSMLNIIDTPVRLVAQYKEKAGIILISKTFTVYNVIAMLLLLPLIGLSGAVLATGSAQIMKSLFVWWHVRDIARWVEMGKVLLSGLCVWGTVVIIGFSLKAILALPSVLHLIIGGALCALGGIVYVRTPALTRSDRAVLAAVAKGKERRVFELLGIVPRRSASGDHAD
jgi:O-antigen/teichoic acid export membrane protein